MFFIIPDNIIYIFIDEKPIPWLLTLSSLGVQKYYPDNKTVSSAIVHSQPIESLVLMLHEQSIFYIKPSIAHIPETILQTSVHKAHYDGFTKVSKSTVIGQLILLLYSDWLFH